MSGRALDSARSLPARVILTVGDSNLAGDEGASKYSWGKFLHFYRPVDTMGSVNNGTWRNEGHSGDTTETAKDNFDAYADAYTRSPTHVVIVLGVNDLSVANGPIATATSTANLRSFYTNCATRWPTAQIVVCQYFANLTYAAQTVTLNAAILAEFGPAIACDLHTGFNTATMLHADNLHLNETGARWGAQRVHRFLEMGV